MRDLFQIDDYIKVNSLDFVKEFRRRYISICAPSRNVEFWGRHAKGPLGLRFRQFLEGETLQISGNRLMVEFPRELALESHMRQMVDSIFFHGGFPSLKSVAGGIKFKFKVQANTVMWKITGPVITVTFDSEIKLSRPIPRLGTKELDEGILISTNELGENAPSPSVLQELVLNPDGVECISNHINYYVITKSQDERITWRKFLLMYRNHLTNSLDAIHSYAKIFCPEPEPPRQKFFWDDLESRAIRNWHEVESYYNVEQRVPCSGTLASFLSYAKSLSRALAQAIQVFETLNPDAPQEIEERFHTTNGYVEVSLAKSLKPKDQEHLRSGLEELQNRLTLAERFLREELAPTANPSVSLEKAMLHYAFRKILEDPLMYANNPKEGTLDFHRFALSLI